MIDIRNIHEIHIIGMICSDEFIDRLSRNDSVMEYVLSKYIITDNQKGFIQSYIDSESCRYDHLNSHSVDEIISKSNRPRLEVIASLKLGERSESAKKVLEKRKFRLSLIRNMSLSFDEACLITNIHFN